MNEQPFHRKPEDVPNFDLKSEVIAINNLIHQLDQRLEMFYQMVESTNNKVDILEEAVNKSINPKYLRANPRYSHKDNLLILRINIVVPFKKNEAELLSRMFFKTGNPRRQKFYFSEVRDEINIERKKVGVDPISNKSLQSTMARIKNRLERDYRAGDILTINTKEFYFNLK